MKYTLVSSIALGAIGALAQTTTLAPTTVSTALVTEYYQDCSSTVSGMGGTVTATVTSDYCPQCSSASAYAESVSAAAAVEVSAAAVSPAYTTVFTTVYMQTCSTGYQSMTYVVTETCSGPCTSHAASVLPQGFGITVTGTETITICTACQASSYVAAATTAAVVTTTPTTISTASIFGQGSTVAPISSTHVANASVSAQSITVFTGGASTTSFGITAMAGLASVALLGAFFL